jgi:hypothetical protein
MSNNTSCWRNQEGISTTMEIQNLCGRRDVEFNLIITCENNLIIQVKKETSFRKVGVISRSRNIQKFIFYQNNLQIKEEIFS